MSTNVQARPIGPMQLPPRLPALAHAMHAELDAVLAHEVFSEADELAELLRYLVERTLDGSISEPSNSSIMIGGFDGIECFGTWTDRAREQRLNRLRAALELHYQRADPVGGLCLMVMPGSYRVWIVRPDVAYSRIFTRPVEDAWPAEPAAWRVSARHSHFE